jgi:hypothetical protein
VLGLVVSGTQALEVVVLTDTDPVRDGLLRQLVERYPDVEIEVKPALEVADIVVVNLVRGPKFPFVQLFMAEGSAISTVIVASRYTFDNLPTDGLFEFVTNLYEARFTLRVRRFPWRVLYLTVPFRETSRSVAASYSVNDIDQWEMDALARRP